MLEYFEILEAPIYRLLVIPLVSAALLTGVIKFSGPNKIGERMIGAAVGIAFAWAAALTLGMPEFPPARDDGGVFYVILAALVIGILLDLFLPPSRDSPRLIEFAILILFGLAIIVWLRNDFDLTTVPLFVAWGFVTLRLRHIASEPTVPILMLIMMALGLGFVAWTADLPLQQDLAIILASAVGGIYLWFILFPQLALGASLFLVAGGTFLFLSLRLIIEFPSLSIAILLLGFILFSDSFLRQLPLHRRLKKRSLFILFQAILSLLPIGLAVAAAFIGVKIAGP